MVRTAGVNYPPNRSEHPTPLPGMCIQKSHILVALAR